MAITVTRVRRTDRGRTRIVGRYRKRMIRSVPRNRFSFKAQNYFKVKRETAITSSGTGTIAFNMQLRGVNNGINWGDIAALYDSYQVMYFKIQYFPNLPNDTSTTALFPILYAYWDSNDAPAVTPTQTIALGNSSMKPKSLARSWKYFIKTPKIIPEGTATDLGWLETADPPDVGQFYLYADGATASLTYGNVLVTYYIRVRMNI